MNFKYFIALTLILALVVPEYSDANPDPACRTICSFSCRLRCSGWRCRTVCGMRCHLFCGKRDEAEDRMEQVQSDVANSPSSDVHSFRISLLNKFSDYDKNEDGRISYSEFKRTMPHVSEEKQIRIGFKVFDKNGDGHIACKEFLRAHADFGTKKPTCK